VLKPTPRQIPPWQRPATVAWQTAWAEVRSRVKDVSREIAQREAVRGVALAELAGLLRDLLGDPFRPLPLDATWLTPVVRSVAKVAYDERRFEDLPVLADALEEAGCDNADILSHLRGPGPHVRGCWAVDLLLGKE
jgi:broad specificity phosphatase PhoE